MLLISEPSGALLLQRRPPAGIWGGLWTPPETAAEQDAVTWCRRRLGTGVDRLEMLMARRHTFSHFHLDIQPLAVRLEQRPAAVADDDDLRWVDPGDPGVLGLPAPIQRLLIEVARWSECQAANPIDQESGDRQ
jgi:A/G-specific adenine glycosylase